MHVNMTFIWLTVALALGLLELTSGAMVLLALATAAALTALAAYLGFDITGQLITVALLSGVMIPIAIWKARPFFSPKGTHYGTAGSGAYTGQRFLTSKRDFDEAICISIKGDTYRAVFNDREKTPPEEHTWVELQDFEGTLAIVKPIPTKEKTEGVTP